MSDTIYALLVAGSDAVSVKGRMRRSNHGSKRLLADGQGARKKKPGRRSKRPRHMRAFGDLRVQGGKRGRDPD